jgi:hypothetical protein
MMCPEAFKLSETRLAHVTTAEPDNVGVTVMLDALTCLFSSARPSACQFNLKLPARQQRRVGA